MPSIQFKGKTFVQNHHLAVPYHELVPHVKKSKTDTVSLSDNLVVHGDNLLALKALLPSYAGRVKMVYIDPPYNTGTEGWVYNDNVSSPQISSWIGSVVGREGEDLTRHDKWLCMMTPRLKLLRELLADDGVIFISINKEENHHLRILLDEIFGATNHLTDIVWNHSKQSKNDEPYFADHYNFVVAYRKTPKATGFMRARTDNDDVAYGNPDDDPRGPWRSGDVRSPSKRETLRYEIETPSGKTIQPPPNGWRWNSDALEQKIESGEVIFSADETRIVRKIYLEDQTGRTPENLWTGEYAGTTRQATNEIKEIFGKQVFETPKPTLLLKRLMELCVGPGDTVLDSFAGSGTTAQAVLELNHEDGGARKFVLVEMEDYADSITAERVRRVIDGVPDAKSKQLKAGYPGTMSYFSLGEAIEPESLLSGTRMPSYESLARYIYFTATGEEFDASKLNESKQFVGRSSQFDVYMYYRPDPEYLKSTALTLDEATALRKRAQDRPLLVFAPTKYVDQTELDNLKITFCQLPFEIYKVKASGTP